MASELIFILSDFFPRAQSAPLEQALPRLAALETLLGSSQSSPLPEGWRAWLAARYASAELAALAPAAAAALCALPPSAAQYWLATPVHYFAGIDRVQLHPAGLLQLSAAEQAELSTDFATLYADAPWRLHAVGAREMLLSGEPLAASGADPAQFAGSDPAPGLPQGAPAATLRRLGVEIEMWLHGHRINLERHARGELPVTTLWFWGSLPPAVPAAALAAHTAARLPLATLYGRDVYAEALWRLRGLEPQALPAGFQSPGSPDANAAIVLWPSLGAEGFTSALQRLEAQWLRPALRALRAGELAGIRLLAAATSYRLRRLHLLRFWRGRAAWWERLS
ncbi:MAG: hypothetical protein ABSH23_01260 [Steroidobacteraceae bacterium]|jgi:hypothetical protein